MSTGLPSRDVSSSGFTYMPIGKSAPVDLMATAKQREDMYHFVREVRAKKPIFFDGLLE